MFEVFHHNKDELGILFDTYKELKRYINEVYGICRIKHKGSLRLENKNAQHLEAKRFDSVRFYKDRDKDLKFSSPYNEAKLLGYGRRTKWRLEITRGVDGEHRLY